jgi:hypothetical protein
MLQGPRRVRHEVASDPPGPSPLDVQLSQLQLIQKYRATMASVELAAARGVLASCQLRLDAQKELHAQAEVHTRHERVASRKALTEAPLAASGLQNWRRHDAQLVSALREHVHALHARHSERDSAQQELENRRQLHRLAQLRQEKFAQILASIRESILDGL